MNYQYIIDQMDPSSGAIDTTSVIRYGDDGSISYINIWSRYWPEYQDWLAEGNTPLPAQ